MAGTFPISLSTLTVGVHNLGTAPLSLGDSKVLCSVDRTVAGGLNSLTTATTILLDVWLSEDSGATWFHTCSATMEGGLHNNGQGGNYLVSSVSCGLPDPSVARLAKAQATVSGTSVAVAGTLTIS